MAPQRTQMAGRQVCDHLFARLRLFIKEADLTFIGIASPSAEAQAVAIRAAYAAAGIDDGFHQTNYLECHGTGTLAGKSYYNVYKLLETNWFLKGILSK